MTLSMVHFTWHIVGVLLAAFGILLMALAWAPDADPRTLLLRWFAALSLAATAQACWQLAAVRAASCADRCRGSWW